MSRIHSGVMSVHGARTLGVLALELAGLARGVGLGIVVSRAASQTVALGGPDLGRGERPAATERTSTTPTEPAANAKVRRQPPRRSATPTTTTPPRTVIERAPAERGDDDGRDGHDEGDVDDRVVQ